MSSFYVRTPASEAEQTRAVLLAADALDPARPVIREQGDILFPVHAPVRGMAVVERETSGRPVAKGLREELRDLLSPEELSQLIASYDVVGSIAILEIPADLSHRAELIAQTLLQTRSSLTTVLRKADKHDGEFRTQRLAYLAGEDTRETLVRESGCSLLVDVEAVYFSVRLATERLRIASLIKPGEDVLILFSGAGPYVVVLAKRSAARTVVGVEKNPVGHRYARLNLLRNKTTNAEVYEADCADLSILGNRLFDRIVMPLPASAIDFLPEALRHARSGCVIHLYAFAREAELADLERSVRACCANAGRVVASITPVKAGVHAPYVFRWSLDITLSS